MTERLYYTDSYLTAFSARVHERMDDGRRVYLDRTAFYPTSGGQPHDVGTIDGVRVVEVVDEGARIAHLLAAPLSAGADTVRAEIDWARRFDHMQQHSGQHVLSAILAERFGCRTVSVHFGSAHSSLDLDVEILSPERIAEAEAGANAIVVENRPVSVSFASASEATGLRKESSREGTLRIISIADLDRSACGGTHVRATGEIGAILIRKTDKVRKSARLEFVCGGRAVHRARADFEALSGIAGALSASLEETPSLVAAQLDQLRALENDRRRLERDLAGYRARELYDGAVPDGDGIRRVLVRREAGPIEELRGLAQAFIALPKAVLTAALSSPPSVLLAASEDSGVDAARVLREALAAAGGRGGGSPRLAQGSVPDVERMAAVMGALSGGGGRE